MVDVHVAFEETTPAEVRLDNTVHLSGQSRWVRISYRGQTDSDGWVRHDQGEVCGQFRVSEVGSVVATSPMSPPPP